MIKNSGRILRIPKKGETGYTCITNKILQSTTLRPVEKSILVHLLSLPQDWVIYKTSLHKLMNIGRNQFDTAWKGLVNKGHIRVEKTKRENSNLLEGYHYLILEEPFPVSPETSNPEVLVTPEPLSIQSNNYDKTNIIESNREEKKERNSNNTSNTGTNILGEVESENLSNSPPESKTEFSDIASLYRTNLSYVFEDYPNWEQELYLQGSAAFISNTREYHRRIPARLNFIEELDRIHSQMNPSK